MVPLSHTKKLDIMIFDTLLLIKDTKYRVEVVLNIKNLKTKIAKNDNYNFVIV